MNGAQHIPAQPGALDPLERGGEPRPDPLGVITGSTAQYSTIQLIEQRSTMRIMKYVWSNTGMLPTSTTTHS